MLTVDDWVTSSGKYPARKNSRELTLEVLKAAESYIYKVNKFFDMIGVKDAKFSSGFRTRRINASTSGASQYSKHMTGHAGDFEDPKHELYDLCMKYREDRMQLGLVLELKEYTPGWCHIQDLPVSSGRYEFIP